MKLSLTIDFDRSIFDVERRLMRGGILAMERFEKSFLLAIGEKMAGTIDDIAKQKRAAAERGE